MYFFSMDVEKKITKKNSIYARIRVHSVTPQPLVSPFKYYKFRLLEHVREFFFLYSSIASLYTLIPSVLARSLSELFVEPRSPVKSHQGDLHTGRNIAESLKWPAESSFLHEILPNNSHYTSILPKNSYASFYQ